MSPYDAWVTFDVEGERAVEIDALSESIYAELSRDKDYMDKAFTEVLENDRDTLLDTLGALDPVAVLTAKPGSDAERSQAYQALNCIYDLLMLHVSRDADRRAERIVDARRMTRRCA